MDAEKLAAYGISGGGYLVPRAVTAERRIKACIGCSIILDLIPVTEDCQVDPRQITCPMVG